MVSGSYHCTLSTMGVDSYPMHRQCACVSGRQVAELVYHVTGAEHQPRSLVVCRHERASPTASRCKRAREKQQAAGRELNPWFLLHYTGVLYRSNHAVVSPTCCVMSFLAECQLTEIAEFQLVDMPMAVKTRSTTQEHQTHATRVQRSRRKTMITEPGSA